VPHKCCRPHPSSLSPSHHCTNSKPRVFWLLISFLCSNDPLSSYESYQFLFFFTLHSG
jgi:hypothetical protein